MFTALTNNLFRQLAAFALLVMLVVGASPLALQAEEEGGEEPPAAEEENTDEGDGSDDGTDGDEGTDGDDGAEDDPDVPFEDVDDPAEDLPYESGGQVSTSTATTTIDTGDAYAEGEASTTANVTDVQSLLEDPSDPANTVDLDEYDFVATGTNNANIENYGTSTATTGDNTASSTEGEAIIETGDAAAVLNIANVINTNIINSFGLLLLLNQILGNDSLDLRDLNFESALYGGHAETTPQCSLVTCYAEDIEYNVSNTNVATILNEAVVRAVTGSNNAAGTNAEIETGDAYAAANLLNVANTNIIDSNYLLVGVNGIGDLLGDIVLPNSSFWEMFFGQPNGMAVAEDVDINVNNENDAVVNNGVTTDAESGNNTASTTATSTAQINTGNATAQTNTINEINKNLFGGDSLYILIKVHGDWSGNVFGLPEGLAWEQTDEGIAIYSEGDEVVPSDTGEIIDVDSYEANFNNDNDAEIDNDVEVYALTGENKVEGEGGSITTGDAYAGANVFNIANTNVVGRNWVMAIFNILGNFQGDISFGRPDLWVGGQVEASDNPVGNNTDLAYTYTVMNNGDLTATEVKLTQTFDSHFSYYHGEDGGEKDGPGEVVLDIGTLEPGEVVELALDAQVTGDLPYGTTPIVATTTVTSLEPENDDEDNVEVLELAAERAPPSGGGNPNPPSGGGDNVDRDGGNNNTGPADITITKESNVDGTVDAGTPVDYTITIKNDGGKAYDAVLYDVITDTDGTIVNEQSWDLEDILAGEEIVVTYTVEFSNITPSGPYTNTATLTAHETSASDSSTLDIPDAQSTVSVNGLELVIDNVVVVGMYPEADGTVSALISWETNLSADSQVVYGPFTTPSPYDPDALRFGYAHESVLDPSEVTMHLVTLVGLAPGTTYAFRPNSDASGLFAMGVEDVFTTPGTAPLAVLSGEAGTSTDEAGLSAEENTSASGINSNVAATASAGLFMDLFSSPECIAVFIFIVLLLALFWRIVERLYMAPQTDTQSFLKHNAMPILGIILITLVVGYLTLKFACVRGMALVALSLLGLFLLYRLYTLSKDTVQTLELPKIDKD